MTQQSLWACCRLTPLLCTAWSRFICARKFLLCSSVYNTGANRRKYWSNLSKNASHKLSKVFGERSHGVEEQSKQTCAARGPWKCVCHPVIDWWISVQTNLSHVSGVRIGVCLLRILLIHFLHTANSMQTASTGSGKGRIILPYSLTVKFHCRRERDSSLLRLR